MLGLGAAVAGAAAAAPLVGRGDASGTPTAYPVAPGGTTLAQTLLHGTPDASGYRPVIAGPGEPSTLRGDLLGGATYAPGTRTPLLALNQLTDMHIIDAQSPARVEFLDRLDDPGAPGASVFPFQASYRAQEMLGTQVAESMIQALNALPTAPVSGRAVDFTICTGDNNDNTQYNELRWQINLMDGGHTITPDSGSLTKWEGVGGTDDPDPHYWHPEGMPPHAGTDLATGTRGFPTIAGFFAKATTPFTSTGIRGPWYTVFGNHDGLVQGNVPSLGILGGIATGKVKVTGLPAGGNVNAILASVAAGDTTALKTLLTAGPAKIVTPDRTRRMLTHSQTMAEHLTTTGTPVGHGYTAASVAANTAYYSFDPPNSPVHCIVLDTCDTNGLDTGSINKTQFNWLTAELKAHSSRYLNSNGQWVNGTGTDQVIVIFSHHTVATMTNVNGGNRVLGTAVANLLLQFPNVVAWVNGHTHRNTVTPHARAGTAAVGGGFWEINTAAHIDWPQQARVVELVDNGDGTLSIFGTIVDHVAPTSWGTNPTSPLELAALSRELGINDWQRDAETSTEDGKRGAIGDRNVELLVKAPFAVV
jgi:metallophosphoesterase (TIGR03767 family)